MSLADEPSTGGRFARADEVCAPQDQLRRAYLDWFVKVAMRCHGCGREVYEPAAEQHPGVCLACLRKGVPALQAPAHLVAEVAPPPRPALKVVAPPVEEEPEDLDEPTCRHCGRELLEGNRSGICGSSRCFRMEHPPPPPTPPSTPPPAPPPEAPTASTDPTQHAKEPSPMPKPSTSPDRRTCAAPGCYTPLRSDNKTGVCSPCSRARKGPARAKPARAPAPRAQVSPGAAEIVRSLPSAPSVLVAGLDVEQLLQLLSEGRKELVRRQEAARSLASRIESAIQELGA